MIIWINGYGLLINPPINCLKNLKNEGIPIYTIKWILLTDCHFESDQGLI